MKRLLFLLCLMTFTFLTQAQEVTQKLAAAFNRFQSDAQMKNGIAALYVIEAKSGKVVFEHNSTIGMAPASTLKIITAASAYVLLHKSFRYTTEFGQLPDNSLYIIPSGDPTLGSWRWNDTKEQNIISQINKAATVKADKVVVYGNGWNSESIPDGWMWQDIGNYYGAGAGALNWRENQYDLLLRSGSTIGDTVTVAGTQPRLYGYKITSVATSAVKGSGDNSYIYFLPGDSGAIVRGTIPVNESRFVIAGAMPNPARQMGITLLQSLNKSNTAATVTTVYSNPAKDRKVLYQHAAPPMDSIVYWFLRRSINLYGEALVKTMGFQKSSAGTTEAGIAALKAFWLQQNIGGTELNMVDGSGLSPLNRVTARAQVAVLQYARKQPWFNGYYAGFPEYNGMKLKSGTINNVKGFAGYHTSKEGREYLISFLVNNYNGTSGGIVQKMYTVLDVLK